MKNELENAPCNPDDVMFIIVAPNVSEQMGGEAIKALHIFQECKRLYPNTIQVTHARNRAEIQDRLKLEDVYFLEDSRIDKFLWRSVVLRWLINWWFSIKAARFADALVSEFKMHNKTVILWQTEPNSPVTPRGLSKNLFNCFGPINGNIYYPEAFQDQEVLKVKLRRLLHFPLQRVNRVFFNSLTKADLILTAGGKRTIDSLKALGCKDEIMYESLDCGIKKEMFEYDRIQHNGVNNKFIHFGRLVYHKGTFLIVKALKKTKEDINLDIVGRGPQFETLRALVAELDLADRVSFLDWYTSHADLFKSLEDYRGFVLPSLEDANGIVVQEAMSRGLPPICLDWGGPQLLIDHEKTGFLVDPINEEVITDQLAEYMDKLALDGELAEQFSVAARGQAESWEWTRVMTEWCSTIISRASESRH